MTHPLNFDLNIGTILSSPLSPSWNPDNYHNPDKNRGKYLIIPSTIETLENLDLTS